MSVKHTRDAPAADHPAHEPTTVSGHYRRHIREDGREARFLIALSFLVTFAIVRFITYAIRFHWLTFLHERVTTHGLHIHRLMYGAVLTLVTGYLALAAPGTLGTRLVLLALLYGAGAALTLDEF